MGGEKHGTKGGGYVGGFLQLFDWNAKARKKLSWTKSDLSEQSKQKKRSDGNLPMTRFDLMNEEELAAGSSIKGCSDYSCASSVTDEEGYGTRAPSVVARLMGLDSMPPSSIVSEPFSTPFSDSQSLRDTHYHRRNLNFYQEHQHMHLGNMYNKMEITNQKATEPQPQKIVNRPIEKFQTEILPPKSAKSIPVTHHKLLSPIKSPAFVPYKNAAHVMEAAARIIEQGPQDSTNAKTPLLGTSSVPLKVRDLKERVESAQKPLRLAEASGSIRPVESNAAKFLKGQSMNKSLNGSTHAMSVRVSSDSGDSSGTKSTGKSVSLALQAKVNVQRREGLNQSDSRSLFGQKEQAEVMSSQPFFKSQPNSQKRTQKKPSAHSSSTVLRQNNQKQNSANDREKVPSKSSLSNSQGRKALSGDSRHKNTSKFGGTSKNGLRKSVPEAAESEKEVSNSSTKNVPRKKRSIDGTFHLDNAEKSIRSSTVEDRQFTWTEDRKRKGSDVVSFTFTAPLTRSVPAREFQEHVEQENYGFCGDGRGKNVIFNSDRPSNRNLSSLRCNVLEADALSVLLERKLKELTDGFGSPSYRAGVAGDSAAFDQDLFPNSKSVFTTPMFHNKTRQDGMLMDKVDGDYGSIFSSTDSMGLMAKLKLQAMDEMNECSSNDTRKLFHYRHPSPISVLEPSFPSESCNSSDSADSNNTEGSKLCSYVLAQEATAINYSKKFHLMDSDAELLDSASTTIARKNKTHFVGSTNRWELVYVKEILFNVELMFKDFALGRAREIIKPRLFDQLESRKEFSEGEDRKLRRKVIFDCVSECMDLRCRRFASGGRRSWAKGLSVLRRKDRLAEEVFKEISGWGAMGDFMVDDLVDKDMSSYYGKWLDFEVESFELGVEIEGRILDSLVNEVVADILVI